VKTKLAGKGLADAEPGRLPADKKHEVLTGNFVSNFESISLLKCLLSSSCLVFD
jgi:hypothetical protein